MGSKKLIIVSMAIFTLNRRRWLCYSNPVVTASIIKLGMNVTSSQVVAQKRTATLAIRSVSLRKLLIVS